MELTFVSTGSGNLGGTNTFRTLGKKAGFIVTIADILKRYISNESTDYFRVRCSSTMVRISSCSWTCVSDFREIPWW